MTDTQLSVLEAAGFDVSVFAQTLTMARVDQPGAKLHLPGRLGCRGRPTSNRVTAEFTLSEIDLSDVGSCCVDAVRSRTRNIDVMQLVAAVSAATLPGPVDADAARRGLQEFRSVATSLRSTSEPSWVAFAEHANMLAAKLADRLDDRQAQDASLLTFGWVASMLVSTNRLHDAYCAAFVAAGAANPSGLLGDMSFKKLRPSVRDVVRAFPPQQWPSQLAGVFATGFAAHPDSRRELFEALSPSVSSAAGQRWAELFGSLMLSSTTVTLGSLLDDAARIVADEVAADAAMLFATRLQAETTALLEEDPLWTVVVPSPSAPSGFGTARELCSAAAAGWGCGRSGDVWVFQVPEAAAVVLAALPGASKHTVGTLDRRGLQCVADVMALPSPLFVNEYGRPDRDRCVQVAAELAVSPSR